MRTVNIEQAASKVGQPFGITPAISEITPTIIKSVEEIQRAYETRNLQFTETMAIACLSTPRLRLVIKHLIQPTLALPLPTKNAAIFSNPSAITLLDKIVTTHKFVLNHSQSSSKSHLRVFDNHLRLHLPKKEVMDNFFRHPDPYTLSTLQAAVTQLEEKESLRSSNIYLR